MPSPPEICPHCGALVPPEAKCCPECGSDEETGWSEQATLDRLGVSSQEDFDYEEFVQDEFGNDAGSGHQADPATRSLGWFWWVVTALLVLAMLSLLTGVF